MSDEEEIPFQVHVTFYGGGLITADSMDEAEEIVNDTDWTANGISSIAIENQITGEEREIWI